MSQLNRNLAPFDERIWNIIDDEIRTRLTNRLKLRRILDFKGPYGFDYSAVNTGKHILLEGNTSEVTYSLRKVLPLVEIETSFTVDRKEVSALERGAVDLESESLPEAVERFAAAENSAILHGIQGADFQGLMDSSENDVISVDKDDLVVSSAMAVRALNDQDVEGPYALFVGPDLYSYIYTADDKGYPIKKRLEEILNGPVQVHSDLKDEGFLSSSRGGDFEFISGEDVSVGYSHTDADKIHLFIRESFTVRVHSPEAVIALKA
jgi:uncharacterized linocin/CFP29 family protein